MSALVTVDDIIVMNSTELYCSACGDTVTVEPEPSGELVALSVQDAFDIALIHLRERHR